MYGATTNLQLADTDKIFMPQFISSVIQYGKSIFVLFISGYFPTGGGHLSRCCDKLS